MQKQRLRQAFDGVGHKVRTAARRSATCEFEFLARCSEVLFGVWLQGGEWNLIHRVHTPPHPTPVLPFDVMTSPINFKAFPISGMALPMN